MNLSGPHKVTVPDYPATGFSVDISLIGLVLGIGIVYELDAVYSASLDIAITGSGDNMPDLDIYSLASAATDGWVYPTAQISDTAGAAIADQYNIGVPVFGNVNIAIANAYPGDVVYVTFILG